jgi:hypothetical protein
MIGHLIHIGYPKTGSSFLRRWFSGHPQLQYADGGIAGFRNVHEISTDSAAPRPGILYRVTSSEALTAPHIHVGTLRVDYERMSSDSIVRGQAQACATLATLYPSAYILLVTRGFRSLMLSSYSQYVRTGGHACLRAMVSQAIEGSPQFWNYDYLIGLYTEAFGDRLIVMPYELLRDDVEAFTRELEGRLGLAHFPPSGDRVNPSLSPEELSWYPRLTRLVRNLPLGKPIRNFLFSFYLRGMITNRFRPLIRILQRLRPASPVTAELLDHEMVNAFRGRAESLRDNPLFFRYRADYLL